MLSLINIFVICSLLIVFGKSPCEGRRYDGDIKEIDYDGEIINNKESSEWRVNLKNDIGNEVVIKKVKDGEHDHEFLPIAYKVPACIPRSVVIEIAHITDGFKLFPHCIIAKRCGGCCRVADMDCMPSKTSTKSIYVYKAPKTFHSAGEPTSLYKVDYLNHESCQCKKKMYISRTLFK